MTIKIKLVPHLLWYLELFITFSVVSLAPFSIQLMHLCSAPWYINVLFISFISDITSRYNIKYGNSDKSFYKVKKSL